jgi:hypothetical protein
MVVRGWYERGQQAAPKMQQAADSMQGKASPSDGAASGAPRVQPTS